MFFELARSVPCEASGSIGFLSIPVEKSSLFRSKIPQPWRSGGLRFRLVNGKQNPAGEAEAGNAGVQPAKE
jgi:hypothetical protein